MHEVLPFQQSPAHCGPASLLIVLRAYGAESTEADIARLSGCTLEDGTPPTGLLLAAERLGYNGTIRDECTFEDLERWVAEGVLPIVNWFSEDESHYAVCAGVDAENVYLQDPEIGAMRSLRREKFLDVWFSFRGSPPSKERFRLRRAIVIDRA